jgi:NitT/TauT family transport system permease protein
VPASPQPIRPRHDEGTVSDPEIPARRSEPSNSQAGGRASRGALLPLAVAVVAVALWAALSRFEVFPSTAFPSPADVARGFVEKARHGSLLDDIVASLFRVTIGFSLAVLLGIPLGLWLGLRVRVRLALLPAVNFFRSLSPLAWIPFAILWFGIGDLPSIFLIFMTAFFPMVLTTSAAVAGIPAVYFRVAQDYEFQGGEFLTQVTLPAIAPQVITALRVTAGLSWVVVVAAEMIAGRDGLGFLIWDARNQLRPDLVVVGMLVIGALGVGIDRLLVRLTMLPSVRWGYER